MVVPAGRSKTHGQNLKAGTQRVVPRGDGKQTVLAHGLSCRSQQKPGPGYEGRDAKGSCHVGMASKPFLPMAVHLRQQLSTLSIHQFWGGIVSFT